MAISEFTEIVLNIAAEVAGYSETAKGKKNQQPPLMQESIGAAAGRNYLQTSSKEERQRIVREKGTRGALAQYRGDNGPNGDMNLPLHRGGLNG
jgi:hypothetical protein